MSAHADLNRFARHVVAVEQVTELAKRAASAAANATSADGGAGAAAAAAAKKAAMLDQTTWNDAVRQDFNIVLGFAAALALLACAPAAASWFANGRYASGWMLRRGSSTASEVHVGSREKESGDKGGEKFSTVEVVERPLPVKITPTSALFASTRTIYNRTLLLTSPLFGLTWGQVVVCLLYELLFTFVLFYHCLDHRTNWRRSAGVALAQLPAVFILATKNNALSLLGKGYEKLNYLHRVAGRLTILGGLLHTLFFLLMAPLDVKKPVHASGLVCTVASVLIFITSLSYFRNRWYQVFLVSHVAGWVSLLVALNFHVPQLARPYTAFVLVCYGTDLACRLVKTRFGSASVASLPGGTVMVQSHSLKTGWRAGQHVWVRVPSAAGLLRGWETHPFTIANAPAECSPLDGSHALTLLAKSTGSWTRSLEAHARSTAGPNEARVIKCAVEGPYGGLMFTDFIDSSAVILVAGGSGITFCASVLEELVYLATQGRTSTRSATLVWTVKDLAQLESYQSFLTGLVDVARDKTCLNLRVLLHVTRPPLGTPSFGTLASPVPQSVLSIGRPSLPAILDVVAAEVMASVQRRGLVRGAGIVVGACGPKPLVRDVREVVGAVQEGKAVAVGGIVCHTESFGW
ncbi:hypothetical protein JCM3775_003890 [Rhodotorula graminis]|uniref:ferric-chelate reductase (NADPH) n=1 Tax=Rhodotorula graminis (strain WP1) TaxID=578459 RepID=A0A194S5Z4_RHOGW|nr:uncharacterized protein RHOBADRAFT_52194 [Rhodotorula graminis WP1]KPV76148.1 hypothetical protein RHOBADRAFT_52194 [Rhodotorula graminis WP1]